MWFSRDGLEGGCSAVGEEWLELGGGHGVGEEEALSGRAAEGEHEVGLVLLFDAFGDGGEMKTRAEFDDGFHECFSAGGVGVGGFDEGLVDLQNVDGELAEVRER